MIRVVTYTVVFSALLLSALLLGAEPARAQIAPRFSPKSVTVQEIRVVGTRTTEEDTVVSPKTIDVSAFRIVGLGATPPFEPKSIQVQEIRVTGTRDTR